ncbi:outer membrane beta-barrel protein [Pseudoalteromonas luteoviolacea]|nr:outer membrane beta-barrel protein [Pseudoalteromonas luteoviolacea]
MNLTTMNRSQVVSACLLSGALSASPLVYGQSAQHKGFIQASWQSASEYASWYERGASVNRFGAGDDRLNLSRAVLDSRFDLSSSWSAHSVVQYVPDSDSKVGFTELYAQYKPISKGAYQPQLRVGGFYPKMSLENPDIGWSSPYNYNYSALNAWLGEELRVFGLEASLKRSGKRVKTPSDHNWQWFVGVYKGNDPTGAVLSWRGFSSHDRQSVFNESLRLRPTAGFMSPQLSGQAWQIEPFTEIDGRFGYYIGAHWSYQNRHSLRAYWYDNNGDPAIVNYDTGQYAWDTKFWSLAYKFKITRQTHLIAQAMSGNTAMGRARGVDNDFDTQFVLLTHRWKKFRISGRIEQFQVKDLDHWTFDPNASDGGAITTTLKWRLTDSWRLGAEFQYLETKVANRADGNFPIRQIEQLWRVSGEYRF